MPRRRAVLTIGLTEASPVVSCNLPDLVKVETVGPPFRSNEVKIAEDGEILIKGENVMLGYWNQKEETEKVIKENSFYPMEKVIQCCNWIIGSDKKLVNGRNFSSVHDPWESEDINIISSDDNNFKLRRYGNNIFHKDA